MLMHAEWHTYCCKRKENNKKAARFLTLFLQALSLKLEQIKCIMHALEAPNRVISSHSLFMEKKFM